MTTEDIKNGGRPAPEGERYEVTREVRELIRVRDAQRDDGREAMVEALGEAIMARVAALELEMRARRRIMSVRAEIRAARDDPDAENSKAELDLYDRTLNTLENLLVSIEPADELEVPDRLQELVQI